ncbi:hypothetical protein [Hoeflea sp.]|uniref:hypothetical protein n=1 Tax=Hoeflea sp. TaxID=1940281 RepID=UPI003A926C1B
MHKLNLSPDVFFSLFIDPELGNAQALQVNRDDCKDAMLGLIERYQLAGKSVLSLGSGHSFEEFWLHETGCDLTLNDIDLPVNVDLCQGDGMTFYHGDAAEAFEDIPDNQTDLLYISSFHPDELRREAIQADFVPRRTPEQSNHYVTWPDGELPYHSTIYDALAKIKDGGLAVFQHYRGGVCIDYNPHYLDAIRDQFESAGVQLLEVYAFRRSTAHVLVVGYKGDASHALAFSKSLQGHPEIKTFHGRYQDREISADVVKAFDLANEQIRPREVFGIGAPANPVEPDEKPQVASAAPMGFFDRLRRRFLN